MSDNPQPRAPRNSWIDKAHRWSQTVAIHAPQWRLAIRMVTAAVAVHVIATLLDIPKGFWGVLTALVVVHDNVGGSLTATRDQLAAALLGALSGLLAVVLLPPPGPGGIGTLILALLPAALASAASPMFRIAPVTAALMLLLPVDVPLMELGFDRVLDIMVGGVVGVIVGLTVLPARAHSELRHQAHNILQQMSGMIAPMVAGLAGKRDDAAVQQSQQRIRAMLSKLDQLVQEARSERQARLTREPDPAALVLTIHRLQTSLLLLDRATMQPLPEAAMAMLAAPLRQAIDSLRADLTGLADAVERQEPAPDPSKMEAAFQKIDESLGELRAAGVLHTLTAGQVEELYTVVFAFGQCRRDLLELHGCTGRREADTA